MNKKKRRIICMIIAAVLCMVTLTACMSDMLDMYLVEDDAYNGQDTVVFEAEDEGEISQDDSAEDEESSEEIINYSENKDILSDKNEKEAESVNDALVEYGFRKDKYLKEHYEKHGKEMGFESEKDYEKAASDVVNNPKALHKTEAEDGDDVYYLEESNEFVIVSTDGYIRTYFNPSSGKKYYDRQ